MANKFETATNNYGNNFSNNNGNHHYTTYGHKYDDSAYVLAKFNGQVDPIEISSTNNGYPDNNVTTYGQGYVVTLKGHTHVDDYTQTITLGWPNNINTKGKIEGTLSFSVDKTSVPASGGTVNIHFPDLKYTGTRDTRGYRYSDVTLKPEVPSNPDTLDDDGTAFSNSTVESTTYVGENRQGFLNYEEPRMDYVIYSSYGNKGDKPFYLCADTKIYNGPDSCTGMVDKADNYYISVNDIVNTYMHMYDNLNTIYSYAYAPYHDEVKGEDNCSRKEGVGWTHNNARLEVADNFLSTFNKKLTMSYQNSYWTISYDGVSNMPFIAAFEYMGTYGGVTSSTDIDTNLTSYDRSTVLHNFFPGIVNSSTTPSYVATSYTISQPKATLTPSYMWSLPQTAGTGASNFDTKTGAKYVSIIGENNYLASTNGTKGLVTVAKQGHYMGYVTGNLDNTLATSASNRIITMDHGTSKEGTIGNLKWTDCENRTERFFNVRVSTKYDNCRNQNITSITNEYASGDKRKPEVTLKCRQLPAHWNHPGIVFGIKCQRYVIPSDSFSRFDSANPVTYIYHGNGVNIDKGEHTTYVSWTISTHAHKEVSTVSTANDKLRFVIQMPTITTPYIKSTVSGSISATASTTYVGPTKSDITITPTWNVPYTRGYDKGFDAAEWKYSFVNVQGYNDDPNSYGGDGMDCTSVTGFNDFVVHLNKCEDFNYRYPNITLTASSSNSSFTLDTTTNTAESEHSLADGAKSSGFTVSVPANPKTGSNWGASIVTTPTETQSGTIRLTSGDMKNSVSRSTTISFSNSFNTDLTSGSITNPNSITITQGADKWGGGGSIGLCFEIVEGNAGQALSGEGICMIMGIPNAGSSQNYSDFSIGKLKSKHQLVLTGIGTVAGGNKTALVGDTTITVTSSGTPSSQSSSDYTYSTTINAWCDYYSSIGTTYGPNGSNSKYVKKYTVSPIAVSWNRQYKFNGSWQNSTVLSIGNNYGSTTGASCVRNSNEINQGPFSFTPTRYNGSSPRTLYYRVGVYDNNTGARYENTTDYSISQDGSNPYYNESSFTFSSSATRCTVNGLQSEVKGSTPTICGSFSIAPDTNPFTGDIAYTNGMVPGSWSNNITSGITSGSTSISSVGASNTNFPYGTTNPNTSIGVNGDSTIQWSTTGSLKYKFYYNYTVTCSSGATASGSGTSDEQTWTPPANVTNYTLKMRYLAPGGSWTSWSTTLTTTANSMGTWYVQGGFFNGNSQYGTSTEYSFNFSAVQAYDQYRYDYTISGNDVYISAWDTSGTVSVTWTCTRYHKMSNETTWNNVGTGQYGSINQTSATLTPTGMGSSATDAGGAVGFTFVCTAPSDSSETNNNTLTLYVRKYGKTYYNA